MAAQYLLPCKCGASISVTPSQAGGLLKCECGNELEVPMLRGLKGLELGEPVQEAKTSTWGLKQGILTVGLLISAVLAGGAGWFYATEPAPPKQINTTNWAKSLNAGVEQLTPLGTWMLWKQQYEKMARVGFQYQEPLSDTATKQKIEKFRLYRNGLGLGAAGLLALSLLAYAVTPK